MQASRTTILVHIRSQMAEPHAAHSQEDMTAATMSTLDLMMHFMLCGSIQCHAKGAQTTEVDLLVLLPLVFLGRLLSLFLCLQLCSIIQPLAGSLSSITPAGSKVAETHRAWNYVKLIAMIDGLTVTIPNVVAGCSKTAGITRLVAVS